MRIVGSKKVRGAHTEKGRGRKSLRIAMASDMHFGKLSGVSHLKDLFVM